MDAFPPPDMQPRPRRPWRPTFGIKTILLVTLLVAVLAATLSGLLDNAGGRTAAGPNWVFFIFLAMAAPMLVMILLSVWPAIRRLIDHIRGSSE